MSLIWWMPMGLANGGTCKAIGCFRMTMRYRKTQADDASLRQRMRAIAPERRRRLSAAACSAQAGGVSNRAQKALPALSGREADGAPPVGRTRPHSQLGWRTSSEFAMTCHPRQDLALRYAERSAPAPSRP